jgi:serine/threonine protein kinase
MLENTADMPYSLLEYRGEYKMEGRLGESGSGPVYSARDAFGRPLAIKVLTGPPDPDLPDRLQAEANLRHKNILTIVSLFRNKDRICIVTDLLEGRNLREVMTEDPSLSLLDRVEIMTQVGEALRYAHANWIMHRGLKPSHIHVQPDGAVKVRSFSIDLLPEATQYMAPEQVAEHAVDPLCNIFTYGVILNELTANCPEQPALLRSIIQRAMNADRESRYRGFDELLADAARLLVQLRNTDLEFTGLFESWSPPDPPLDYQPVHDNVQFTVYRPRAVRPGEWKTLLAFAHLSERPADAPEDDPDPIKDVQQRANQILGKDLAQYQDLLQDSARPIPQEGELTFVPQMNGIEFNPRRVSFLWQESIHQAAFRLRATPQMDGQTVRGQMCVYLGSIIVAQVPLSIEVNSQRAFQAVEETLAPVTAARYRRIFASYSHKDVAVVEEFERYGRAIGDEYLRDVIHLRSGEVWNDRLPRMIDQASVFQLFWSSNSINSPFVRQEWQYALALNRDGFVRPVYWEPELNLPPEELRSLHFHRVVPGVPATPETPAATPVSTFQVPVYSSPPPVWEAPPAPHPQAPQPNRKALWLQLAAAVVLVLGVGGLIWHALHSRRAPDPIVANAPVVVQPNPIDSNPPVVAPGPELEPKAAPLPTRPIQGTANHYALMLWSRGMPILPDQIIRGDDPFLQSSFTLDDAVPADASVEVEWYLNGVSSGVTDFDPAEKGKHKSYMNSPRDGNYRAVLLVNRKAVASLSFSYRK